MGEPHSGSPVGYYFLFNVLQGIVSFLAGANLHDVFYVINEDLAVANMSGVKDLLSGLNDCTDRHLADHDIHLYLGQ